MNVNIQQLVEKAKKSVPHGLTADKWIDIYNEKFAQLIVQECVDICQDTDGEEDAMALCGRQDCAVEIREHFGVEE
jgi:hypothetical protein